MGGEKKEKGMQKKKMFDSTLTLEKFKACVWGDQTCRKETKPNKLNTKKEITLLQRSCRVGGKIHSVCCEWVRHHEEIKALV